MPAIRLITFAFPLFCSALSGEEPTPLPAAFKTAAQRITPLGDGRYRLGDIEFDANTRRVTLPCTILHREVAIEYLLVHETGKDHETVLTTPALPIDLQVAMLLNHYQPGNIGLFAHLPKGEPIPMPELSPRTPGAHRVLIEAEWEINGEKKHAPLSDWFQHTETRQPPPDLDAWHFTGSQIDERGFAAEAEGSFIAVYADRFALFNSPAAGNHRDDLWISLPANIPPEGTAVTLSIAPAP